MIKKDIKKLKPGVWIEIFSGQEFTKIVLLLESPDYNRNDCILKCFDAENSIFILVNFNEIISVKEVLKTPNFCIK